MTTRFFIDPQKTDSEIADAVLAIAGIKVVKHDDPVAKFRTEVHIAKTTPRKNMVFGWANLPYTPDGTQIYDYQGHAIDLEEIEDTAYNFTISRYGTGDMHTSEQFGELVESMIFTPEKQAEIGIPPGIVPPGAWWIGFKVPPEYWDSVVSGERTMFSIEGSARLDPV